MSDNKIKVLFLDVDGVLNSAEELFDDRAISPKKLEILKTIIDKTNAKIVLISTWRCFANTLSAVIEALETVNLELYGITREGVAVENLKATPWANVKRCPSYIYEDEVNNDRGAEIAWWYWNRREKIDKFAIVDDEDKDIINYFPKNIVKTSFSKGLTSENAATIIKMLEEQLWAKQD